MKNVRNVMEKTDGEKVKRKKIQGERSGRGQWEIFEIYIFHTLYRNKIVQNIFLSFMDILILSARQARTRGIEKKYRDFYKTTNNQTFLFTCIFNIQLYKQKNEHFQ